MPIGEEEHYAKQKAQTYAYFRVRALPEEREAMGKAQFTIYDFVTNAFAFSRHRKELTIKVFEALQQKPHSFAELLEKTGAGKSSLFLGLTALERSGLVEKGGERGSAYKLSAGFSHALRQYADWWEKWAGLPRADGFK